MVCGRNAATGEYVDDLCDALGCADVRALEHAVAVDVGVQHAHDAQVPELLTECGHFSRACALPAVRRHVAIARIHGDEQAVSAYHADPLFQDLWTFHRCGSYNHSRRALVEHRQCRFQRPHAATDLNRHADSPQQPADHGGVAPHTITCAVEIHDVQALGALGH